jgi:hypothetical protein
MSGIEIITLTPKGEALSHSVRPSSHPAWRVIYFLRRLGNRATFDKICTFQFGGDVVQAKKIVGFLKDKGIVVGE